MWKRGNADLLHDAAVDYSRPFPAIERIQRTVPARELGQALERSEPRVPHHSATNSMVSNSLRLDGRERKDRQPHLWEIDSWAHGIA